jgi:arginine deiminase
MESLMSLDTEEAIKKQIEDRKNILNIKTGKIVGAGDEFVFEIDTKKAEVTESDVEDFVKKLK